MKFLAKFAGALALLFLFIAGSLWAVRSYIKAQVDPDPVTIVSGSIDGLREQNRLSAFEARYVAIITSTQTRLGLSTQRTMIMPGLVRYEVDLGRLNQKNVVWDPKTKTLGVTLPGVEVSQPSIDFGAVRSYGENGLLATFTDATRQLDDVNRLAAQKSLRQQALTPQSLKLARDATRRAVERSFAMPLRAAGINANVKVRFADELTNQDEVWDTSRSIEDVLANRW